MSAHVDIRFAARFGTFRIDVDTRIPGRGMTGLFGRSGAGKTTLLRCVAGLEQPASGRLDVCGETWFDSAAHLDRPMHKRGLAYVFQEPRLFGHLDVLGNLEYGHRRAGARAKSVDMQHIVDLFELNELLHRRPDKLSGGEAQRVAIARALCSAPRLLLMDEPLASLDEPRRQELLPILERLHTSLDIPALYVSHNIDEVSRLCDSIVVIDHGSVVACGELQQVLTGMDVPVLAGREAGTVIEAMVAAVDTGYELTQLQFSGGELAVPGIVGEPGNTARIRIRANDVSLCRKKPEQTTILNVIPATIDNIEEEGGATVLVRLLLGDDRVLARITRRSLRALDLKEGESVLAQVKSVTVRS